MMTFTLLEKIRELDPQISAGNHLEFFPVGISLDNYRGNLRYWDEKKTLGTGLGKSALWVKDRFGAENLVYSVHLPKFTVDIPVSGIHFYTQDSVAEFVSELFAKMVRLGLETLHSVGPKNLNYPILFLNLELFRTRLWESSASMGARYHVTAVPQLSYFKMPVAPPIIGDYKITDGAGTLYDGAHPRIDALSLCIAVAQLQVVRLLQPFAISTGYESLDVEELIRAATQSYFPEESVDMLTDVVLEYAKDEEYDVYTRKGAE